MANKITCKFFMSGCCKYGSNCRFFHPAENDSKKCPYCGDVNISKIIQNSFDKFGPYICMKCFNTFGRFVRDNKTGVVPKFTTVPDSSYIVVFYNKLFKDLYDDLYDDDYDKYIYKVLPLPDFIPTTTHGYVNVVDKTTDLYNFCKFHMYYDIDRCSCDEYAGCIINQCSYCKYGRPDAKFTVYVCRGVSDEMLQLIIDN